MPPASIAVIGRGNIGATLASRWKEAGHAITIGARRPDDPETQAWAGAREIAVASVADAIAGASIVLIATPGRAVTELAASLGTLTDKLVIDATNMAGAPGQATGFEALTRTGADVVKAFNCTGWENLADPRYGDQVADMFMAGGSLAGRAQVASLSRDLGFETCYDLGGNDRVHILESFAMVWIDLAIFQKLGRDIAFKLLRREG